MKGRCRNPFARRQALFGPVRDNRLTNVMNLTYKSGRGKKETDVAYITKLTSSTTVLRSSGDWRSDICGTEAHSKTPDRIALSLLCAFVALSVPGLQLYNSQFRWSTSQAGVGLCDSTDSRRSFGVRLAKACNYAVHSFGDRHHKPIAVLLRFNWFSSLFSVPSLQLCNSQVRF